MAFTVQTAKAELAAMLHGTTLNQVENIDGVFNRAARQLLLDIDTAETKRVALLAQRIYDGVFDYAPPIDLKGTNKVIDLGRQLVRRERFIQTYNQYFDLTKYNNAFSSNGNEFTVLSNTGTKILRISYVNPPATITINSASTVTGNGTWATSGTASNIQVDSQTIMPNNANPLMFDITTGTGYVENSTMTPVDLSAQENQSGIFWYVFTPVASQLTSVNIRFGSSSTDYWEATGITTTFAGNAFNAGWNQVYVLWENCTPVGSPDASAIDYVRLGFVVSANMNGMEFSGVTDKQGVFMDIEYYSKYLFSTSGGTWQETVTDDSNIINLDTDSYNIFLYQVAFLCVQQALGQDAGYDTNVFLQKYNDAIARYKRMYKSEITKPQQPYYTRTFNGYQEWLGQNYNNY